MNNEFIDNELQWLTRLIVTRMKLYFGKDSDYADIEQILPQSVERHADAAYVSFIQSKAFGFADRVMLMMGFVPFLKPQLLDCFQVKNTNTGQHFYEFACVEKTSDGCLQPTLATVLFILSGENIEKRLQWATYFTRHPFFSSSLFIQKQDEVTDFSAWRLRPAPELLDRLIFARPYVPHFSMDFPARHITTTRAWNELVLEENTMRQLNEIKAWVKYGEKVRKEWHLEQSIKQGYRALFYGPSGSGKTFTATLMGKEVGREVYSIDLSMVISKYIGETEKNLSKVFDVAEGKDWILFFDEADALFGKRTNVKDAHDRYANQEVAYLLQRVENYNGLVILSSNLKSNIDDAFARRFQSMVRFSMPDVPQRLQLWKNSFSLDCILEEAIDLQNIAQSYELSGGNIMNVIQFCSVMSMSRNENTIRKADLMEGIRKELSKVGKLMKGE